MKRKTDHDRLEPKSQPPKDRQPDEESENPKHREDFNALLRAAARKREQED